MTVVHENGPDEAYLVGTREGYLRLARELLALVDRFDGQAEEMFYSQRPVEQTMCWFPATEQPQIVGCYCGGSPQSVRAFAEVLVGDELGFDWTSDP